MQRTTFFMRAPCAKPYNLMLHFFISSAIPRRQQKHASHSPATTLPRISLSLQRYLSRVQGGLFHELGVTGLRLTSRTLESCRHSDYHARSMHKVGTRPSCFMPGGSENVLSLCGRLSADPLPCHWRGTCSSRRTQSGLSGLSCSTRWSDSGSAPSFKAIIREATSSASRSLLLERWSFLHFSRPCMEFSHSSHSHSDFLSSATPR